MSAKTIHRISKHSAPRFLVVGAIGFMVDASILHAMLHLLGPLKARLISFLCAVSVTWFLNRQFTFKSKARWHKEWLRYTLATGVGAIINLGSYSYLVLHVNTFYSRPLLALIISSLLAMGFNYFISTFIVFDNRLGR